MNSTLRTLKWSRRRVLSLLAFVVLAQPGRADLSNLVEMAEVVVVAKGAADENRPDTQEQRSVVLPNGKTVQVKALTNRLSNLRALKGKVPDELSVLTFHAVVYLVPFQQVIPDVPCMLFLKHDDQERFVFADNYAAAIPLRYWEAGNGSTGITEVVRHQLLRSMKLGTPAERLEAFGYARTFGVMPAPALREKLLEDNKNPFGVKVLLSLYRENKGKYADALMQVLAGDDPNWQVEQQDTAWLAVEARRLGFAEQMSEEAIRRLVKSSNPSVTLMGYQACFDGDALSLDSKLDMLFAALARERPAAVRAYAVTKLAQLSGVDLGVSSYAGVLNDAAALEEAVRRAQHGRDIVTKGAQSRKQRHGQRPPPPSGVSVPPVASQ